MWQGYINIPAPGTYIFETVSDDGSKLYFNKPPGALADVDNDGVHAAKSASKSITIPNAGVYPIAITYFELNGGETMEVYWSGPGIPRQRIPNEAFALVNPEALSTPLALTNSIAQEPGAVNLSTPRGITNRHSVYPNPFDESVTIGFYNSAANSDISISIFGLDGREVLRKRAGRLPVGDNAIKVNLKSLNIKDGVYIVQVQKNGIAWKTEKVIKMKK